MKFYIENEKNKFNQTEFEDILYDACKKEVLNSPTLYSELYMNLKKETYLSSGVLLYIVQTHFNENYRAILNGQKIKVDDINFYKLDEKTE